MIPCAAAVVVSVSVGGVGVGVGSVDVLCCHIYNSSAYVELRSASAQNCDRCVSIYLLLVSMYPYWRFIPGSCFLLMCTTGIV